MSLRVHYLFKGVVCRGITVTLLAWALNAPASAAEDGQIPTWRLPARVVAVGLPGVAGVRQVGRFHSGGPIPGNPEFLMRTGTGEVLDPERVMVAVASNFGASLGDPSRAEGAILSIDLRGGASGEPIVIPEDFAAVGGQSTTLGGVVQVYTSQSAAFRNSQYNANARTAELTAASGPRYISNNNAFGRPWIANAPKGLHGEGSVTVVDPDGAPLDNAPSSEAGGVFAGEWTNRERVTIAQPSSWIGKLLNYRASPQLTTGELKEAALGTAFLGPSPDDSGFAVFAAVTGDGAIAQIHVQDGIDGLAPPGTVQATTQSDDDSGVIGMAFEWTPKRVLYVADPGGNRIVRLHLSDDRRHFEVARSDAIALPALNKPVDIAAAMPEIANPRFSSHTTLAGGSDLYVVNRGDGSLLRVSQDGRLMARAEIDVPGLGVLRADRIRAIAVSADAQRLWLTIEGELPDFPGHAGALIEISAFDQNGALDASHLDVAANPISAQIGEQLFQQTFTPGRGLGPLFNARSCATCHPGPGGISIAEDHFVRRVAYMDPVSGRVAMIAHPNSPVARRYFTNGLFSDLPAALPRQANVSSLRMPLPLYGVGQLDDIPDSVIAAQAMSKGDGIKGRVHYVTGANGEQRVGRYGWKAHAATLDEMVAEAFANELGITTPVTAGSQAPDNDGQLVRAVSAYLRQLSAPREGSP